MLNNMVATKDTLPCVGMKTISFFLKPQSDEVVRHMLIHIFFMPVKRADHVVHSCAVIVVVARLSLIHI